MQITAILGLVIGLGGILVGNLIEGGSIGGLLQLTAFFIVFGGTLGATMLSSRFEDLKLALKYLKMAFGSDETRERGGSNAGT